MPIAAAPAAPKTKRVVVTPPEGFIPYVNWPPIPAKNVRKAFYMDSTNCVSDSAFRVVSSDGRNFAIYSYDEVYITREEAWASVLEYFEMLYASVA